MTYVVLENCIKCKYTDCVEVCPVEAFHEGETMVYIHPESCIDCDACVDACPVEAIFSEDDLPEKYQQWLATNAEKSESLPVITTRKDPLPGALTLDEIRAKEAGGS